MKPQIFRPLAAITRICVLMLLFVSTFKPSAFAQEKTLVEIPFKGRIEASSALGLVISPEQSLQKKETEISYPDENTTIVSFHVTSREMKADTFATAMLVSEEGAILFGDMKPLDTQLSRISVTRIPLCKIPVQKHNLVQGHYGMLEKLVEIREAISSNAQAKVAKKLQGEFLAKLIDLEKVFGLTQTVELSPNLAPHELIDRLARLLEALKDYKNHKRRKEIQAVIND